VSNSERDIDDLQEAFNTVTRLVNEATLGGRMIASLQRQVREFAEKISGLEEMVDFLAYDTTGCEHEKFKEKRGRYCPQCGRAPGCMKIEQTPSEDFDV
jgi:hypothetical protein